MMADMLGVPWEGPVPKNCEFEPMEMAPGNIICENQVLRLNIGKISKIIDYIMATYEAAVAVRKIGSSRI